MADKTHQERLDSECLERIMQLAGLQNDPNYTLDQEGMNFEAMKYIQLIRDPIKRRQAGQMFWDARADRIRRQRSANFIARLGKYNI
jgi:hypothetical protein